MPAQKTSGTGLLKKYGQRLDKAIKEHADDPVEYGNIRLPAGINNGVARLVSCKFDVFKNGQNTGEVYFRAAGVVVEPASVVVDGREVPVRGLQTSIMEPVCDTKTQNNKETSLEEHVAKIENEMKKLGLPPESFTGSDVLEDLAATLQLAQPYFRFSTSPRLDQLTKKPTGECWENWHGVKGLENFQPDEAGGVDDQTEQAPPAKAAPTKNGTSHAPTPTQRTVTKQTPMPQRPTTKKPEPEPAPPFDEFGDLDSLVQVASDEDDPNQETAQNELSTMAIAAGATEEQIAGAESWEEVAALITAGTALEEVTNEGPVPPNLQDVVKYTPVDKKTGKPGKGSKPVECVVTATNTKTLTADLRSLDNPKLTYKAVPWDQLSE